MTDKLNEAVARLTVDCERERQGFLRCVPLIDDVKLILTALASLREERHKAEQWMRFNDIRKCDIAACNCGMWHGGERSWEARYKELKYQIESGEIVVNKES